MFFLEFNDPTQLVKSISIRCGSFVTLIYRYLSGTEPGRHPLERYPMRGAEATTFDPSHFTCGSGDSTTDIQLLVIGGEYPIHASLHKAPAPLPPISTEVPHAHYRLSTFLNPENIECFLAHLDEDNKVRGKENLARDIRLGNDVRFDRAIGTVKRIQFAPFPPDFSPASKELLLKTYATYHNENRPSIEKETLLCNRLVPDEHRLPEDMIKREFSTNYQPFSTVFISVSTLAIVSEIVERLLLRYSDLSEWSIKLIFGLLYSFAVAYFSSVTAGALTALLLAIQPYLNMWSLAASVPVYFIYYSEDRYEQALNFIISSIVSGGIDKAAEYFFGAKRDIRKKLKLKQD